jgi:hypothetical protein
VIRVREWGKSARGKVKSCATDAMRSSRVQRWLKPYGYRMADAKSPQTETFDVVDESAPHTARRAIEAWTRRHWLHIATSGVVTLCLIGELLLAWKYDALILPVDHPERLPVLRLAGACAVGIAACWACIALARTFREQAVTSWWEPSERFDKSGLEWDEVYRLVAFNPETDPVGFVRKVRWHWWGISLVRQVPLYLVVWGIGLTIIDLLRNARPRTFLTAPAKGAPAPPELDHTLAAVLGNPTAYLALFGALATIFFTFRQIRAKVRADSRQAWIVKARELLGKLVSQIDVHRDLIDKGKTAAAAELWSELNPGRLEFELMLNPSEKDHRLLLYMIQNFSAWRETGIAPQDGRIVRADIAAGSPDGKLPEKWTKILDTDDRSTQVSYILRLSHVVLKREWERVKHTQ